MILLFIGSPGSGKDTQADFLVKSQGYEIISTGQLMRDEIARGTELGKHLDSILQHGWASDEVAYQLLSDFLRDHPAKNIIFDGAVRRVVQVAMLDEVLAKKGLAVDKAIFFDIPEEEAVRRLLSRGRSDDNEGAVKARLEANRATIQPILDAYQAQGKLVTIDGMGEIADVKQRLNAILQN